MDHLETWPNIYEKYKTYIPISWEIEDWETQIHNIGRAYYAFYCDEKNYFQILFLLQHGEIATKVSDEVYQSCTEEGLLCLGILCKAIELGMEKGEIRGNNATELAVLLWGSLNGIILLHQEEEHEKFIPFPLDKMIQTSFTLLIDGLRKR